VISLSYGVCELQVSAIAAGSVQAVAQQANAQGMTWLASSGDSGAAGCDQQGLNAQATQGLSTSVFASIPEVTGVGGTQFNEGSRTYWSNTNSPTYGSALSYIPEAAWNESGLNGLDATGGGLSVFYPKPSWQTGPGVPNVNQRGVPDLSLTAAGHDAYRIVTGGQPGLIAGTSAATPSFAGIVALLNQYQGSTGQGNINPNLYRLAQTTSGVFHDITTGNNIVPCMLNTPDCSTGSFGYDAGPGYDLATGLGSVDAYNLITQWNNGAVSTTTIVTANPSALTVNGSTQLTATVTAGSGVPPTGTVAFNLGSSSLGMTTLVNSGGNATATLVVYGSQLAVGSDTVTASYSGSTSFNSSVGFTTVNVSLPIANSAVVPSVRPNPVYQQQADADGYSWFYTILLTEVAGANTTLTRFTINGTSYAAQIINFFGSSSIPALGTISARLRTKDLTVPTTVVFGFSGVDPGGRQWSQQLSVPFYGPQITASMVLSSQPDVVRQNPNAASTCQWYQNLALQEQNGRSVHLTRFLAAGYDLSSNIQQWFGSTTLPALGSLLAGVCWRQITPPYTVSYEIDGTDDAGNKIVATLSALFKGPATNPGPLSLSQDSVSLSVANSSQSTSSNITVNVNTGQQWAASVFPSNRNTKWLVTYPLSGAGPANITVLASGSDLANGVYKATLVIQSIDAVPQFIDVPVALTVGPTGLNFTGSMPHLASGGGWDTTLTLVNTGPAAGEAHLSFFGEDGSPLQLPFTFPQGLFSQFAATIDQPLSANSVMLIDTQQPSYYTQVGSTQLFTSGNVGGFAIFKYLPSGQEAVVPLETRNAPSYVLAYDNTGALATGVAIANVATQQANIPIVIRDDTGAQIGSDTIGLAARGHTSFLLTSNYAYTAGRRGTIEFDTPPSGQISALGLRANASALTTVPVLANVTTGGGSMAHVASGGGWQTVFTLVNTGTSSAQAQLSFFENNGQALLLPLTFVQSGSSTTASTVIQTIAAGATLVVLTQGNNGVASVGSAQLTTDGNVGGFAIFRYNPTGQEAIVPLETRNASAYVLAFDNTNGLVTGVALANVSNQAVNVPVILRDDTGASLGTATIGLAARGHRSFVLTSSYPLVAGKRGTVEFDTPAGGQISGLGVRATPSSAITTIPVLAK
jgi:hypothetical protein